MRRLLLSLCVFCLNFNFITTLFADNVSTGGKWGNENYRSTVPSPPTLSIEGSQLTIQFQDELSDLKICIIEERNTIVYENIVSGQANELFHISLEDMRSGSYKVFLIHSAGWMFGYFEI